MFDKKNATGKHDDHIFPLSLGGSNDKVNHQLLDARENLLKSNAITEWSHVQEIDPMLLSERYRDTLQEASTVLQLKQMLSKKVHEDMVVRSRLPDQELLKIYKGYCEKNNLRRNVTRAVKKFREFCKMRGL
jgi:hypothetical protein